MLRRGQRFCGATHGTPRWRLSLMLLTGLALLTGPSAHAALICLDPGHGGSDPGATGCNLHEADVNLDTQLRLRDLLQAAGHQVIMTRDDDTFVSLTGRTAYANSNGADRFVSIHSNSYSATSTGTETFCAINASSQSQDLRGRIQVAMIDAWGLIDRGVKAENFTVLTTSTMPATLSEMGFISNCSVDALLLGDPDARQVAAAAHLLAIQGHLGEDPIDPELGWARGVVFADQGVGTTDMSHLLPGAQVLVVETGASLSASDPEAAWSFTLAPGEYTLRASALGYISADKTCSVNNAATSWCSIGLFANGNPVDAGLADTQTADNGLTTTDAQASDVTSTDLSGADSANDAGIPADTGIFDDASGGTDAGIKTEDDCCGCACASASGSPPAWALGLLLIGLGMRRRSWRDQLRRSKMRSAQICSAQVLSLLCVTGLAAQSLAMPPLQSTTAAKKYRLVVDSQLPALRLDAVEALLPTGFSAPSISPDGQTLLFSNPDLSQVWIMDLQYPGRPLQLIAKGRGIGLCPVWRHDSRAIGLRDPKQPFSGQALSLVASDDGHFMGLLRSAHGLRVGQAKDQIILWRAVQPQVIAGHKDGDRFFAPQLSPNGQWVVLSGLRQGLFLYRVADGQVFALGAGDAPQFSEDSGFVVLSRSRDDGEKVVSAALFLLALNGPTPQMRTIASPAGIAQSPSLNVATGHLVFVLNAQIVIADIDLDDLVAGASKTQ